MFALLVKYESLADKMTILNDVSVIISMQTVTWIHYNSDGFFNFADQIAGRNNNLIPERAKH